MGIFNGGGSTQLIAQLKGAALVSVWSFVVALIIGYVLKIVGLMRVKEEHEVEGIDTHQHKESAYESFSVNGDSSPGAHAAPPVSAGV